MPCFVVYIIQFLKGLSISFEYLLLIKFHNIGIKYIHMHWIVSAI